MSGGRSHRVHGRLARVLPAGGGGDVGHEAVSGAQHVPVPGDVHVQDRSVDLDPLVELLEVHVGHAGVPVGHLAAHGVVVDVRAGQTQLLLVLLDVCSGSLDRASARRHRRRQHGAGQGEGGQHGCGNASLEHAASILSRSGGWCDAALVSAEVSHSPRARCKRVSSWRRVKRPTGIELGRPCGRIVRTASLLLR